MTDEPRPITTTDSGIPASSDESVRLPTPENSDAQAQVTVPELSGRA